MGINPRSFIRSTLLLLPVLILVDSIANGQTISSGTGQEEVAEMNPSASNAAAINLPVFTDYRGVTIGFSPAVRL